MDTDYSAPDPHLVKARGGDRVSVSVQDEAEALIRTHGHRAVQRVIDELVLAIKCANEPEITRLDGLLKAIDRILETAPARR